MQPDTEQDIALARAATENTSSTPSWTIFGVRKTNRSDPRIRMLWFQSTARALTGGAGLDRLPYAVEALFNSYAKQHSPSCLHNTRIELLREILYTARLIDKMNGASSG